jgi:hypothetical protein
MGAGSSAEEHGTFNLAVDGSIPSRLTIRALDRTCLKRSQDCIS